MCVRIEQHMAPVYSCVPSNYELNITSIVEKAKGSTLCLPPSLDYCDVCFDTCLLVLPETVRLQLEATARRTTVSSDQSTSA